MLLLPLATGDHVAWQPAGPERIVDHGAQVDGLAVPLIEQAQSETALVDGQKWI